MSSPTSTPQPGWHPDPTVPGQHRYWDGQAWTEHTTTGAQTATLDASPAAATKAGKPFYRRWWVIALAAIVVLVVGVSATGGGGGSKPSQSQPSTSGGDAAPTQAAASGPTIGDAVRDGKFEFTVKSVRCGVAEVGDSVLGQTAQGQYCLVALTVKNIGSESQTMFDSNQKLVDAAGNSYDADSAAALYANGANQQVFITPINPGNAVSGVVVFDVPKTVHPTKIELHDSAFSGGITVALVK